ncbi:replication initiation and membrane attachment family protein [Niallia sp. Krafla_26]|uniref:replication initiation and membrane attachment family protein n=1 Tax=Niallia sp. Krafla_26 TaxID=3064703 RepID=UPI003D17E754
MAQHWQELLPIDHYVVTANGLLHDYDRKILTFLYQPLIGAGCLSLYMTLWAELEENRLWSHSHSHHSLMNFMDVNLKEIYEKRLKLEAIGLLKTFVKQEEEGHRLFIYEMQPPLSAQQFLSDGMLNIYLYRKIGRAQFARVKRFFSDKSLDTTEFEDVTRAFQDVFSSGHTNLLAYDEETKQELEVADGEQFIGRNEGTPVKVKDDFNFDLLFAGLHESLISKEAFTKKVLEAISSLSFLYGIDAMQMKNIVISAIQEDNKIDIEELRKSARDWYQLEHYDNLPALIENTQPVIYQTINKEPQTQEEKLIHYFETTSPLQYLKDIGGGAEPSKADVKIIEDVMFGQKLNPGVLNVLIDNVMRKTDMKLTKSYVEKIASHWARKNIKTVKEAMDLAKKEHRQYLEWAEGKKNPKQGNSTKKPIRTEILPDWFDDDGKRTDKKEPAKADGDLERKKQELEEMMKKLRS